MATEQLIVFEFTMSNDRVITTDPRPAQVDSNAEEQVIGTTLADLEQSFIDGELVHVKRKGKSIGVNTRHLVTVEVTTTM